MEQGAKARRRFALAAGLAVVTTGVLAVWLTARVGGDAVTTRVDDIAELMAALVAAAACAAAARRTAARAAWGLLGASSFAWAVGQAVWTYYEVLRGVEVPFPSLADIGFLAAVPLAAAGLVLFPSGATRVVSPVRRLLDSAVVAGAVFICSWSFVLRPIFDHHAGGPLKETISLAYPSGDVVLVSLVVILATRPGVRNRGSLWLVMAGMFALALADSSFAYLTEVNTFGIGNGLDTGWIAGFLAIGLGAMWAAAKPVEPLHVEVRVTTWTVLGPYLPLVAAFAVYVWRLVAGPPLGTVSLAAGLGLVSVLSLRQVLVLLDNIALNRELEGRVEERTAALAHQAFHDGLTGLANRDLFNEVLAGAVRRRARSGAALTVLFVDLDGFKQVNDLYGHRIGDRVLQEVARRLRGTLREADTIARLGGDEFAVLVEGDPATADPERVAQRLLHAFDEAFRVGDARVPLRASVGVVSDGAEPNSAEDLLRDADLAMYTAKRKRLHSFEIFVPEMHSAVLERMRIESDLRNALENHEFVLHYQPIVTLPTATIEGVEALIRWHHPTRGLVEPAEFISIAESSGLIVPIGAWALRQACREVASWGDLGAGFRVSVNISPAQFADLELLHVVGEALATVGLEPSRLTLEVTESLLIDGVDHAVDVLEGLRALGVRVAIDDFGTGFSSLSSLRDLPVDTLKIDRSFVVGVDQDGPQADLARRILELAGIFHLHTVAEGVEDRTQLEALERLGCDSVQGFYFYKPLPAEALVPVLKGEWAALSRR